MRMACPPRGPHRMPERLSRSVTRVLHAASTTPKPMGKPFALAVGITHAVAIATEVAQDLRDTFALGMLRTQMAQCPNHLRDTVVVVAQQMAILLELRYCLGVIGSIGRIEGIAEMLRGVVAMPNSA